LTEGEKKKKHPLHLKEEEATAITHRGEGRGKRELPIFGRTIQEVRKVSITHRKGGQMSITWERREEKR